MPCLVCGGRGKFSCACTRKVKKDAAILATAERNRKRQNLSLTGVVYTAPEGNKIELYNPNILRIGQVNRKRFLDLAKKLNWSNDNLMDNLLRTYERHAIHV